MVKLSVCVEMFWKGIPVEEKVGRVKKLGFGAFEFWGWKNKDLKEIRAAREETGLVLAAVCTEPNFALTESGSEHEVVQGVIVSARAVRDLGCRTLIVTTGNVVAGETFEITRRRVVRKLKGMARAAEGNDVTLVLEPLNPVVDHKGYWLTTIAEAVDIVEEVGSPALKILVDLYHQQVTEGNLIMNVTRHISLIGHFHSAGVPGRHELTGGELDYRALFSTIGNLDYRGYVGLEFAPTIGDEEALKQALSLTG